MERIRMWLARLRNDESLRDFDLTKILKVSQHSAPKVAFEINLGVLKVKIG